MRMASDEEDADFEMHKPRLDMRHGFIYHIRNNQISRDNYDKKVKSGSFQKRGKQPIAKKPENKLYMPPARNNLREGEDKESCLKNADKKLFILEYTENNGKVHKLVVKQGQDACKLAKRLQNEAGIPSDLVKTLEWKIKQEQDQRS